MSSLEVFGRLLSETVAGEKLSSSKVERVRDSAEKQFNRGAKTSSIIVKVHRKASGRSKLPSLYLFDAVCRHASDIVRKRGSGYDYKDAEAPSNSEAERGTKRALVDSAASFLKAANEILEEMVLITIQAVREDQKVKVIKVVDIWIKANTFDEEQLMRVKGKLIIASNTPLTNEDSTSATRDVEQEGPSSIPSPYGMLMSEERAAEAAAAESTARTSTPPQLPSHLLALLGGGKTEPSKEGKKENGLEEQRLASLDANQLAMLQKIAQQNSEPGPIQSQQKSYSHHYEEEQKQHQQPSYKEPHRHEPPSLPSSLPTASSATVAATTTLPNPLVNEVSPSAPDSNFVPNQSIGDLSQFNMMEFDATNAAHWLQFAQHWHNTYQYIPSNQEMMFAIMSAMQSQMYASSSW